MALSLPGKGNVPISEARNTVPERSDQSHPPEESPTHLRGQRFFQISGAQKPKCKSLKKSRAARAKSTIMTGKNRDSAVDNGKNEDPAKMTYSIPDFVSRNRTKTQDFFQVLESDSTRSKIKS